MAVLVRLPRGCLLDHEEFVEGVYRQVVSEDGCSADYSLLPGLFAIASPFRTKGPRNRKRKKLSQEDSEHNREVTVVKDLFYQLMEELKLMLKDKSLYSPVIEQVDVKKMSKDVFEQTNIVFGSLQGGNNSEIPLKCKVNNELYLIPPISRFVCGNVVEQIGKLEQKYDLVIADPPWWNKYIRRLKVANPSLSYSMMYNEEIASIPLRGRLAERCLVAVWCTNSPSNVKAVHELIFPAWGVVPVATWYWVKVTRGLDPVCDFGAGGAKQPYERLVLGAAGAVGCVPDRRLLVSVPSALHSHKPPLLEVLSPYLEAAEPRSLELFARYLLPRTTSIGYEPLKWQNISLYQETNCHSGKKN